MMTRFLYARKIYIETILESFTWTVTKV